MVKFREIKNRYKDMIDQYEKTDLIRREQKDIIKEQKLKISKLKKKVQKYKSLAMRDNESTASLFDKSKNNTKMLGKGGLKRKSSSKKMNLSGKHSKSKQKDTETKPKKKVYFL